MIDNSPVDFKHILFQVWIKGPLLIPILSAVEKICHIPHAISQTTGQLKVMLDKSVNVLGEGMSPIEFQLFGLSTACLKLSKFLIWLLKSGASFV